MTVLCLDVGSTWTKGALVSRRRRVARHRTAHDYPAGGASRHRRGRRCPGPGRAGPRVLVGGRRVAARGRRAGTAGQRRGRVPGGVVGGREGGARVGRSAGRRGRAGAARGRAGPGPAGRRHGRRRRVGPPAQRGQAEPRSRARSCSRATPRRSRRPPGCSPRGPWCAPRTCCRTSGELAPGPARAAIREVFLRHVIGGKGLSRGRRFRALVRAVTPDAVLRGRVAAGGAGPGRRGAGRGRRRRHHGRLLRGVHSGRSGADGGAAAGPPHRRRRPRHALVGARRGGGSAGGEADRQGRSRGAGTAKPPHAPPT